MSKAPYHGWIILGVAMLAVFVSSPGQTYVVSVFVDPIPEETGWSRTAISGPPSARSPRPRGSCSSGA
jgi:hypothetical protein